MPKTTQRGLIDCETWDDYRWHLANRIVDVDMLRGWIDVTDDEAKAIEACAGVYRWSITPYYAERRH
jgi:lysine 2,3-aminomutase